MPYEEQRNIEEILRLTFTLPRNINKFAKSVSPKAWTPELNHLMIVSINLPVIFLALRHGSRVDNERILSLGSQFRRNASYA